MRQRLRLLIATGLMAGTFASAPVWAEDAPDADTVVATVNGTEITLGHMIILRAGLPEQFTQLPANILYTGILDQLIQQTLLQQSHSGDISKAGALALENERRAVVASEVLGRIARAAVDDDAVTATFEAEYLNSPAVTEYHAAHILVETEEEAANLVTELRNGADFAELAREHSTGPSGPGGGELGWFSAGMMVEPFQLAVEKMEVDSISDPVETQFGWHVIRLIETRTKDRPALDDVRAEIEDSLRQAAVDAYVADLREKGEVKREEGDALDPELLTQFDLLDD